MRIIASLPAGTPYLSKKSGKRRSTVFRGRRVYCLRYIDSQFVLENLYGMYYPDTDVTLHSCAMDIPEYYGVEIDTPEDLFTKRGSHGNTS